mmetsp:Transcript_62509/g.69937  ORF Transcript_62509/g.69937 Transcript_62509/m.69937 type:complete len:81 (-) Transcript_62509:31-273(-)
MVLVVVSSSVSSVVVSSSVLSMLFRHNKNIFCDIADDIAHCCCHGWITKDELGMIGVGESWIELNQLYYIDGGIMVDIVQ